ncbi:hypothetical protein Pmani_032730 [Petrolisthes manimaculis]|uniref:Uncharacterized protein n=1 Tax=Petrolisthes manimaculis TaxID=1843537 RepID=A0AAE1NT25_9EUCA|nr:hypothetical protein Pmani_032730 [Petrolisthes manimaculis]
MDESRKEGLRGGSRGEEAVVSGGEGGRGGAVICGGEGGRGGGAVGGGGEGGRGGGCKWMMHNECIMEGIEGP